MHPRMSLGIPSVVSPTKRGVKVDLQGTTDVPRSAAAATHPANVDPAAF
jgi:hypothetical protein